MERVDGERVDGGSVDKEESKRAWSDCRREVSAT